MFVCNLNLTDWTANTAIKLSSEDVIQTNSNVRLNDTNDGLLITSPGWYKVKLQSVVTGKGTTAGAVIAANGDEIEDSEVLITLASGDEAEVITEYPIHIVATSEDETAQVQINAVVAATPVSGYVSVTKVQ